MEAAKRKIARRFSAAVFRGFIINARPETFSEFHLFFFFPPLQLARASGYGELWSRKMRDTAVPAKIHLSMCRDRNCFKSSLAKCFGSRVQILKLSAAFKSGTTASFCPLYIFFSIFHFYTHNYSYYLIIGKICN